MKKLKIKVTQDDIDKGYPDDGEYCPIARAIKRIYPTAEIHVGKNMVELNGQKRRLPYEAKSFIHDFDDVIGGQDVEPFEFEIIGIGG